MSVVDAAAAAGPADAGDGDDRAERISAGMADLYLHHFARRPSVVRTLFPTKDVVLVLLEGSMTPAERRLAGLGRQQDLREARVALQHAAADEFREVVDGVLGRRTRAFTSAHDVDSDVASELFLLGD